MQHIIPVSPHTVKHSPTEPASSKTPFGETKMPLPTMMPTMMPTPFTSPSCCFSCTRSPSPPSSLACSTMALSFPMLTGDCVRHPSWPDTCQLLLCGLSATCWCVARSDTCCAPRDPQFASSREVTAHAHGALPPTSRARRPSTFGVMYVVWTPPLLVLQTVNGLRTTCLCFNFSKQSRSSHKQINPLSATSREESQQTLAPSACRQGKTNSARPQHKWSDNQHKHCNVYTCRLHSIVLTEDDNNKWRLCIGGVSTVESWCVHTFLLPTQINRRIYFPHNQVYVYVYRTTQFTDILLRQRPLHRHIWWRPVKIQDDRCKRPSRQTQSRIQHQLYRPHEMFQKFWQWLVKKWTVVEC